MKRILLISFILGLIILSCAKKKESFLLGRWQEVQRVTNPKYRYIWDFKGDGSTLEIFISKKDTSGEYIDLDSLKMSGTYNFNKENVVQFYLEVGIDSSTVDLYYIDGKYWIEEISREVLLMTREKFPETDTTESNPFYRLEFIKL